MTGTTPATTLADRAVLRLSGDDVRGFLQGLVTVDTQGPLPRWTALLTPQGKALFDFILWADGEDVLIDCAVDQADALAKRLTMYRLRRAIAITREEVQAVHWSPAPRDGAAPDPRLPTLGYRWLAPPGHLVEGWREHRLTLGVCEGATELAETLWLECNAAELNGVDFAKGCYVGQENTARMHYRAKVNRRLVVAPLDETDERRRAVYPDLNLMVTHRRVEALGAAIVPEWLAEVLKAPEHN
jgi:hypothetical protein